MAKLECTHGNNMNDVFPINEGENKIGRGHNANVRLFDKTCSRTHCVVTQRGKVLSIEDAGSRHGTFINGKKLLKQMRLQTGDRIQIGHTVLKVGEGVATDVDRIAADLQHQAKTAEISERMLAAELDVVKVRRHHTKKKGLFGDFFKE